MGLLKNRLNIFYDLSQYPAVSTSITLTLKGLFITTDRKLLRAFVTAVKII